MRTYADFQKKGMPSLITPAYKKGTETILKTITITKPDGTSATMQYVTDPDRFAGVRVYAKDATSYYDEAQFAVILARLTQAGATVSEVAND